MPVYYEFCGFSAEDLANLDQPEKKRYTSFLHEVTILDSGFPKEIEISTAHEDEECPWASSKSSRPHDWAEASKWCKNRSDYICQECNVDLNCEKRLLHVHHVDENPGNNTLENLIPLCLECHSKKHEHMIHNLGKPLVEFIGELRDYQKKTKNYKKVVRGGFPALFILWYFINYVSPATKLQSRS